MTKSITDHFDGIKNKHLGLVGLGIKHARHFKHIGVLNELCSTPPKIDGYSLASSLLLQVYDNWSTSGRENNSSPSRQNWRFTKVGKMALHNPSPEVTFERTLVDSRGDNWANQVPTSCGIVASHADRRRSIDLVERVRDQGFDFIELKIGSDTPLYAALEVLDYGVLYAFSRLNAEALKYDAGFSKILEAKSIGLRVLAPSEFYSPKKQKDGGFWDLSWLESTIQNAAGYLSSRIGSGFTMNFRFDVFSEGISWNREDSGDRDKVLTMIDGRRPLISADLA